MSGAEPAGLPNPPLSASGSWLSALAAHVRVPLHRDGYALVLNSLLTAPLGVAFWLLAARHFTPRVLGINTAAISAMMFIAGVSQLNLMSALLRFLPVLGAARRRFIAACYLIAGSAAVVAAVVFLVGVNVWTPALHTLGSSPGMVAWFVGGTVAWCLFNLQDSALTGLGAAVLVPVDNLIFGIAKIVLLVALVSASPRYGIFASWTAALPFSLVPINAVIFGRLLRRRRATASAETAPAPSRRDIVRYAAPDYLAGLLVLSAMWLMPVFVLAIAGPAQNAYFSVAWLITVPLMAISASTGAALVVTAAADPPRLPEYARKVLLQTGRLVVPAAVATALLAPYLLRLFGPQYAEHAALTLSLLALSTIPAAVTALYVSTYRVQRNMRAVVALTAAVFGSVLVAGAAMLAAVGIAGVGLAWLVCQSIAACVLLARDSQAVGIHMGRVYDRLALGAVAALRKLRTRRLRRRSATELAACVPSGLALSELVPTVNDVLVGRACSDDGERQVFVKLARTPAADASLQRAGAALVTLAADARLTGWEVPRPKILDMGELDGRRYVVESALIGTNAAHLLARGAAFEPLLNAASVAIEGLHRRTADIVTVDRQLLERWIELPTAVIEPIVAGSPRRTAALHRLAGELSAELEGRKVTVSWVHGDFAPENVLIGRDGRTITGIVDWEQARYPDLPAIDTTTFALAAYAHTARRQFGQLVATIVRQEQTGPRHALLAQAPPSSVDEPLEALSLTLLCWLRHVSAVASKSERYARHPIWKRNNVYGVLDGLGPR